jgi:hypothetical protein
MMYLNMTLEQIVFIAKTQNDQFLRGMRPRPICKGFNIHTRPSVVAKCGLGSGSRLERKSEIRKVKCPFSLVKGIAGDSDQPIVSTVDSVDLFLDAESSDSERGESLDNVELPIQQEESLALSEDIGAVLVEEIGDSYQLEIHDILQVLHDVPTAARAQQTAPQDPQRGRPVRNEEMKV